MGLFGEEDTEGIKNIYRRAFTDGNEELMREINEFALGFGEYVGSKGIKLEYDPNDKQFKQPKGEDYDALYITPFDSLRLYNLFGKFRWDYKGTLLKNFKPNKRYFKFYRRYDGHKDYSGGRLEETAIIELTQLLFMYNYVYCDKRKYLIDSVKETAHYPRGKPLDVLISSPTTGLSIRNNSYLGLILDAKDKYEKSEKGYNPYELKKTNEKGSESQLPLDPIYGVPFDTGGILLLLPKSIEYYLKHEDSFESFESSKREQLIKNRELAVESLKGISVITKDLPYYELARLIYPFLESKLDSKTPISYSLNDEFIGYLRQNL